MDAVPEAGGSRVRLAPSGELDFSNADDLRAAITHALNLDHSPAVTVDLAGVRFLDSYAIGVLVGGRRYAIERNTTFRVANAAGHVHRVLQVTGLLDVLTGADPEITLSAEARAPDHHSGT